MENIACSSQVKKVHPWAVFVEGIKKWKSVWLKLAALYLLVHLPVESVQAFAIPKMMKVGIWGVLIGVLRWLIDSWVIASLLLCIKEILNGNSVKLARALKLPAVSFWRYILTLLLKGVILGSISLLGLFLFVGMIMNYTRMANVILGVSVFGVLVTACVAAAVFLGIRLSLSEIVALAENDSPASAIKISFDLIKRHVTGVLAELFLIIIMYIFLLIPFFLLTMRSSQVLIMYQNIIVNSVIVPLTVCIIMILYNRLKEIAE